MTLAKRICPKRLASTPTNLTPGERSDLWREGPSTAAWRSYARSAAGEFGWPLFLPALPNAATARNGPKGRSESWPRKTCLKGQRGEQTWSNPRAATDKTRDRYLASKLLQSGQYITLPCLRRVRQNLFAPQSSRNQITLPGVPSQPPLRAHGRAKMAGQRGIYLTFGDACVIISACKAYLRHQMCPKRLPEEHKNKRPACATKASLARRAEHARSHGTAASAAGKFCCVQCRLFKSP